MTEKQTHHSTTGERYGRSQSFAGQVGSAVSRAMQAAEAKRRNTAEIAATPRTKLDQYADGSVIKTYKGPQTLKAGELAKEIVGDPVAADVGPILVRAVAQRTDGSSERRVLFFDGYAMMGGVVAPDGSLHIVRKGFVDEDALQQTPDIEIGKPWKSPLGNVGEVKSVSMPLMEAFDVGDLSYPGPDPLVTQPLALARDLLEQFEQTQ